MFAGDSSDHRAPSPFCKAANKPRVFTHSYGELVYCYCAACNTEGLASE
jgi:hypothetical protein